MISTSVKGRKFARAEKMGLVCATAAILMAFVPIALTDDSRLIFPNLIIQLGGANFNIWYAFRGYKKLAARYETRNRASES